MNKEEENQFKENIKEIARLELKNSFNNNLMETLNSAFIFKYVDTLEKQSKKHKEIIDKIKHILNNQMDYREFVDIVNAIEDILKEVE